jgi:hypothetical protein
MAKLCAFGQTEVLRMVKVVMADRWYWDPVALRHELRPTACRIMLALQQRKNGTLLVLRKEDAGTWRENSRLRRGVTPEQYRSILEGEGYVLRGSR